MHLATLKLIHIQCMLDYQFMTVELINCCHNIITLTCISTVCSNGNEFVLVLLRVHSEVAVLRIAAVSFPIQQVNAQALTLVSCQHMKLFVTCTILSLQKLQRMRYSPSSDNSLTYLINQSINLFDVVRQYDRCEQTEQTPTDTKQEVPKQKTHNTIIQNNAIFKTIKHGDVSHKVFF